MMDGLVFSLSFFSYLELVGKLCSVNSVIHFIPVYRTFVRNLIFVNNDCVQFLRSCEFISSIFYVSQIQKRKSNTHPMCKSSR